MRSLRGCVSHFLPVVALLLPEESHPPRRPMMRHARSPFMHRQAAALAIALVPAASLGATLQVGPGKTYAKPCAAFAAAADGDTIEIDAGRYDGDVCAIARNDLTIRGVG